MDTSYILNHLGENRGEYYGAVAPPVFQSSIFCLPNVAAMRERIKHEGESPFYTRGYNPTAGVLRKKIAALEGAEDALVFASGSAATSSAVMSVLKGGDHAVCVQKPYSWAGTLLGKYLADYGISCTFIDGTDPINFSNAIRPDTKLIYLESPNSLTFEMQDIAAVTRLAREKNITTIIDNSYSSPLNQSPIALGADMVVHSASKYLNGHSDTVAGAVCASHERILKMMSAEYMTLGGIISPHDAWLILRGLRTLELRVNRSCENAGKIVPFLESHPKIEKVFYPFSKDNPQLTLAKRQMKRGGGLVSILLKGGEKKAEAFCDSLRLFLLACSWGGYESLAFPVCSHAAPPASDPKPIPRNLVRLYFGIENADLLLEDLKQALEKI